MRTIIDEGVLEKAKLGLKKMGRQGTVAKKLQAVIASHRHGIKQVSAVFNVSKTSIYLWAKQIQSGELEGLLNQSKHQDGIKLKKIHQSKIQAWLEEEPHLTIASVKAKLKDCFQIEVSKSTVHRAMRGSGFSYITPRKRHYLKDETQVKIFKKGVV